MKSKFLIIGHGSIGKKHAKCLEEADESYSFVSKHKQGENFFATIAEALKNDSFSHIWICSKTIDHEFHLSQVKELGFKETVILEKPIFKDYSNAKVQEDSNNIYVSYNLRFLDTLQLLKEEISKEELISVEISAGQYLPDWRPKSDYLKYKRVSTRLRVDNDTTNQPPVFASTTLTQNQQYALSNSIANTKPRYNQLVPSGRQPVFSMEKTVTNCPTFPV